MKKMNRKIPATFTVAPDQYERLVELSERTGVSRSHIIRDAITIALDRFEEDYRRRVEAGPNGSSEPVDQQ